MTECSVRACWRCLLAICLLAGATAAAEAPPPSGTIGDVPTDTLLLRIERLVRAVQGDSALALVRPLLESAAAREDPSLERRARLHEASALCILGRLREGETASRRALSLARAAGDSQRTRMAMRWLAYSLLGQGRRAESAALYRALRDASLPARDAREEAYARMGLSYFALQDGNWREAEAGYRRAIALFARSGEGVMELEAMVGLARAFALAGRYDQMRRLYMEILERAGAARARQVESYALNNLAVYESQAGDPARAMEYCARAASLLGETGDLRAIVVPSLNLAAARLELGELDEAERALAELSARCQEEGYLELQAAVLNHLGAVRAAQGRPQAAAETWQGVLRNPDVSLEERAVAAQQMAAALNAASRHAAALALLDADRQALRRSLPPRWRGELLLERAAALHGLDRHAEALSDLREAQALARAGGFRELGARGLLLQGRCELALGAPDSAAAHLWAAQGLWEDHREVPREPRWREQRGALGGEIHLELARLLLREPAQAPVSERRRAAIDLLQRYKARTLLERMLGPDVFDARDPRAREAVTLAALQEGILRDGELLLDFYLGEAGSLLIAASRDSCAVFPLAGRGRLAELTELYLALVARSPSGAAGAPGSDAIDLAARRLGRELFEPARAMVDSSRRVILALDGLLSGLPVEQLCLPAEGGRNAPSPCARIGDRGAFRVPSASVLSVLRGGRTASPAEPARGVLALSGGRAPDKPHLPGAAAEAAWLAARFRDVVVRDDLCPEPGGDDLIALCRGRQVLHIAAHSEAFDQRPWLSRIWLGADDQGEPCALDAAHIASLPLRARLAVISGCESAAGRMLAGEGVLGLTGAFLGAGVTATVVSLWPVDDVATLRLMRPFYRELARGRPVADALRRAQAMLRNDRETAHPFYWAGFVVVGDGLISVQVARRTFDTLGNWVAAALAVLALGLGAAALRARRRRGGAGL